MILVSVVYQYKQMTNFDKLNSLDPSVLKKHMTTLERGEPIDKPNN
jgi:uridine kinase